MEKVIKSIKSLFRVLVGFVFLISGIIKLMDPVGAGLVVSEYYEFLHIGFLDFSAEAVASLVALFEAVLGALLITGVWQKFTATATISIQGFFTLLTLFLFIFQPEMDCGCFGEAIHLTHTQTFVKNIILMAMVCIYALPYKMLGNAPKRKFIPLGISSISILAFSIYSWMSLPLSDFTEYKSGNKLISASQDMDIEYESIFTYRKDTVERTFTIDNLPDSTWTYVSTETIGREINGNATLSIYDEEGIYHDEMLNNGSLLVMSLYDADLSTSRLEKYISYLSEVEGNGIKVMMIASQEIENSAELDIEAGIWLQDHLYFSDYKTLITLNRDNGGTTLFTDGTIVEKWAWLNRPSSEEISASEEDYMKISVDNKAYGDIILQAFLLYVCAILLFL